MASSEVFHHLRPTCALVSKDPSVTNLRKLHLLLKELPTGSIKNIALMEYVLFPLKLMLQKQKTLKEEQEILCYNCIELVMKNAIDQVLIESVVIWNFNLFSMFFGDKTLSKDEKVSEELLLAIVGMISSVCASTSEENLQSIYQEEYLPLLGHMVSVLIDCIEKESNRKLQLMAFKCLKYFNGFKIRTANNRKDAGEYMASFLPGTAVMFRYVFQSSKHQHHKIILEALDTFSHVLCCVLDDDHFIVEGEEKNIYDLLSDTTNENDDENKTHDETKKFIKTCRNKKWLEKTSTNVNMILKSVLSILMCHANVKVRLGLVNFIKYVLSKCMKTLSKSTPEFIDCLVKLSCDGYDKVKSESLLVLESATKIFKNKGSNELKVFMNEKLYSEFLSLPRIMYSVNEDLKLAKVQIIQGHLQFYGDQLLNVLNSYPHLEKFLAALLQILQLDSTSSSITEERTWDYNTLAINSSSGPTNKFQRKHFKLFNDTRIIIAIKNIIHLLAAHTDVNMLIDYLMEQVHQNSMYRVQAILIINEIILSLKDKSDFNASSIVEMLLSTYLDDSLWLLPVNNHHLDYLRIVGADDIQLPLRADETNSLSKYTITYETLHNNVHIISLLLEGISILAETLKTNFNIFLIRALFPVLEKVGSTNATISCTAMECLKDIVKFCNYADIPELILINSDYLLNAVTMQFRHLHHGTAAPAVLCVVLKFCDYQLLPILSDAVDDVFRALDNYQDDVADDMLNVLKCLAIAVDKWHNSDDAGNLTTNTTSKVKDITSVYNNTASIKQFFTLYCQLRIDASGEVNEEDFTGNEDTTGFDIENNFSDEQKIIPLHFQTIITSLEKCVCFIASSRTNIKLKALDVTYHGVMTLRNRENDLLPILHKLWPAVINRLKDNDQVVVLKTLDVLLVMVKHSGDFLRKRMSTEFLSVAIQLLEENRTMFTQNSSKYTQTNKVLVRLISYLGNIVPTLDVSLELFCHISTVCAKYFDSCLHSAIQEASFQTMRKFSVYKPDCVWLLLQSLENTQDLSAPETYFKPIVFNNTSKKRTDFSDNIRKLLATI